MVERREAERSAAVDAPVTPRSSTSVHAPQMCVSSTSSKSSPLRKKEMGLPSSPRGAVKNASDSGCEYSSWRSQIQRGGQASVRERAMTSGGGGGGGEQPKSPFGQHPPRMPMNQWSAHGGHKTRASGLSRHVTDKETDNAEHIYNMQPSDDPPEAPTTCRMRARIEGLEEALSSKDRQLKHLHSQLQMPEGTKNAISTESRTRLASEPLRSRCSESPCTESPCMSQPLFLSRDQFSLACEHFSGDNRAPC
jgi:hypothetical protein